MPTAGLTPLFHTNMTPYGEVQLRRDGRLDLSDASREWTAPRRGDGRRDARPRPLQPRAEGLWEALRQGDRVRGVAAVERQVCGAQVAPHQQPPVPPQLPAGVGCVAFSRHRGAGLQGDPGPGIPAWAVRAGAGRADLPGPPREVGGHLRGGAGGGRSHRQPAVAGDGQAAGQPGIGAVDLIGGDPAGRDAGVQGTFDQRGRQRRLGREPDLGVPAASLGRLLTNKGRGMLIREPVDDGHRPLAVRGGKYE